jgi:hypothetical protein
LADGRLRLEHRRGASSAICMSPNLAEEILVLFLGSLAIGFLILAIVHFYRSSNDGP